MIDMSTERILIRTTSCLECLKQFDAAQSGDWFFCSKECRREYQKLAAAKMKAADKEAVKHAGKAKAKKRQ